MSTGAAPDRPTTDPSPPRRRSRCRRAGYVVVGAGVVATIAWVGLQVDPQPLPAGLPASVEHFYTELYGAQIPVVDTAVITGRGEMRISGITFRARWRFSHITGQDYRHYIELTAFGSRLMAVNEWFLNGDARLELPFGVSEGPNIDETSARLMVPFEGQEEAFVVQFDPDTGLLERMESMRFKGNTDRQRTLWINEVLDWGEVDGHPVPLRTEITWGDEDSPWAHLHTESVIYNADLRAYVEAEGP